MTIEYEGYTFTFYPDPRDWELHPIPVNQHCRNQVDTATLKRTLSGKREQESEPARLSNEKR